jgi:DNA-binding NtrC family response regulator
MKTILVIEEDLDLSYSLCRFFRGNNFDAIEAANLSIEPFSVKDRDIDLVICSFESLAFARTKCSALQKLYNIDTATVPWILLTAEASIFDLSGQLILSEVTILRKPLELNRILEIAHNAIERDKKSKALNEIVSALNSQYYLGGVELQYSFKFKSTHVKIKTSSANFSFIKRRVYLPIDKLYSRSKAKTYYQ